VYPSVHIWAPWNLETGRTVGIGDGAWIYNPDRIILEDFAIISQDAFLCAASHDYTQWTFPLITAQVRVSRHAWVAARAFVHMGVTIGEGCVIGAGSVVTRDTPPWTVCAGNPCKTIRSYDKN
jgi:putative colanic acid biosynthesis acetyltransferase WcaF